MAAADALDRIVAAVSDGAAVDWAAAAALLTTAEERGRLDQLRVLDEIARFHRANMDATVTLADAVAADNAPRRWGSLEIREALGAGAFGRVFLAWDAKLEREVALKLVATRAAPADESDRYLREGRLMARVRHPNVAQVYGADICDGSAGMWMELVRGRTLESQILEEGPFSEAEAARIGIELCRGLAAVHAAGLVHRDVKTSNVMRERGGRIVLMDLGAGFAPGSELARAGETTGTPFYMAPEILDGGAASTQSDLYSLGVVLFRLVSARFPVEAKTLPELKDAHAAGRRTSLRDLRPTLVPEFVRIVERAIAADSAARFSTAGELQAALESLAAVAVAPAPPARTRRRMIYAALAIGIIAAVAMIVPLARRHGAGGPEVTAAMYRATEKGRERLRDADAVGPGDRLSLDFRASERVYAYVVNQDDSGKDYLLFPLRGFDPSNPLSADTDHRLPGSLAGRLKAWVVSAGEGTERFLIVASRTPLTEFEADLAALPVPTADSALMYAELSGASQRRLRSVAGLADDEVAEAPAALFDRLERLGETKSGSSGVWVRQLRLRRN